MIPTIRTIIADDEGPALRKLRMLLTSEAGVEVVAECRDGKQTIAALQRHKPDLLLLDIRMPHADGFQVLNATPASDLPVVIFTTAYDRYAVRAFEAHALDYLLKPFDEGRFHFAMERVRAELLKTHTRQVERRILDLLSNNKRPSRSDQRLVIKTSGRVVFLDFSEIDWIEAAANYVELNAGPQSYLFRESIGRMSERLDPGHFVRIHRSVIVNVSKIKELQLCNSGEYLAVLKNGKQLPCSRGYRPRLQELIEGGCTSL